MNHWPRNTHRELLRTPPGKGKRDRLIPLLELEPICFLVQAFSSHSVNAQNAYALLTFGQMCVQA